MLDLKTVFNSRLDAMEQIAKQGVIPGQLDTYELEQLIGHIKELKYVLGMMEAQDNEVR